MNYETANLIVNKLHKLQENYSVIIINCSMGTSCVATQKEFSHLLLGHHTNIPHQPSNLFDEIFQGTLNRTTHWWSTCKLCFILGLFIPSFIVNCRTLLSCTKKVLIHKARLKNIIFLFHSIHTYIFISLIQSVHQLCLNMEHVNKHQITQDTYKNTFTR